MPSYNTPFVFPLVFNGPNFLTMIVLTFVADKLPAPLRIAGSYFGAAIVSVVIPFATQYLNEDSAYVLDIVLLVLFGVLTALLQGAIFGLAGLFPGKYTTALLVGQGLAGLVSNVLRAVVLLALPPTNSENNFYGGIMYYFLAALLLTMCGTLFLVSMSILFLFL